MKTIKFLAIALVAAFTLSTASAQTSPAKVQKPSPVHTAKVEKKTEKKVEKKADSVTAKKTHTKATRSNKKHK